MKNKFTNAVECLREVDEMLASFRNHFESGLVDISDCIERAKQLRPFEDAVENIRGGMESSGQEAARRILNVGVLYISRILFERVIELESP